MSDKLVDAMANMKERDALILAEKRLNQGEDPFPLNSRQNREELSYPILRG